MFCSLLHIPLTTLAPRKQLIFSKAGRATKQAHANKMAAIIDLHVPETVTCQTIRSTASIILNSPPLPRPPPPLLSADLNIYGRVSSFKPAFMCEKAATQAAIPGKISCLI